MLQVCIVDILNKCMILNLKTRDDTKARILTEGFFFQPTNNGQKICKQKCIDLLKPMVGQCIFYGLEYGEVLFIYLQIRECDLTSFTGML